MRRTLLILALSLLPGCADKADGRWLAETIDGRPISVAGGHDGCNGWSATEVKGLIISDLQECPPPTVAQRAFATAVRGEGSAVAAGRRQVADRGGGHRVLFRRQPKS